MSRKIHLFSLLVLLFVYDKSQAQAVGQWSGPTSVYNGSTQTYSFNAGGVVVGPSWTVGDGTATDLGYSGTIYSVSVHWTTVGTGRITLKSSQDGQEGSLSVTVAACPGLSAPSATSSFSRCGAGTLTLTATPGSGGTSVKWYSAATGGTLLATGTTFTTPSFSTGGTIYYITSVNGTCESSPRTVAGTIAINAAPTNTPLPVTQSTVCGDGTTVKSVPLSASITSYTIAWYSNNTSGTVGSGSLATGTSYTASTSVTKTYYLATYNSGTGCETAPANRIPIVATVNITPVSSISSNAATICSGSSVTITPSTTNTSGTAYAWTVTPSANISGASGTTSSQILQNQGNTPATVNYKVTPTANTCTGNAVSVTVNVNPIPILSVNNIAYSICSGQNPGTNIVLSNPNAVSGTTYSWSASGTATITGATSVNNTSATTISQVLTSSDHTGSGAIGYWINASATFNGVNCSSLASGPNYVTVNPIPIASLPDQTIFVGATGNLPIQCSTSYPTFTYSVTSANNIAGIPNGSTPVSSISFPVNTADQINPGSATYSITPISQSCAGASFLGNVSVYPTPIISTSQNTTTLSMGIPLTLSAQPFYDSYTWQTSTGTITNSSNFISIKLPYTYTLSVSKNGRNSLPIPVTIMGGLDAQNQNYIVSNTTLFATSVTTNLLYKSSDSVQQSTQYFDGLGKLVQTVATQGSPQKYDLVQPNFYDAFSRESKKYLPFVTAGDQSGFYKPSVIDPTTFNYIGVAGTFYTADGDKIANDSNPYSQTNFEASPLNRPLFDIGPGHDWVTNNKGINHYYLMNDNTVEQVIAWKLNGTSGMPVRKMYNDNAVSGGYYLNGQLTIRSTVDEHNHETREYTDKDGHVILKKVQLVESPSADAHLTDPTYWTQTYYVYDDFGLLRYVFPPELSKYIVQQAGNYNPSASYLAGSAFQYRYDERNRMIVKHVPGAGWQYMVYDVLNRLVMTQDAIQRKNLQWLVTKYDILNRPILTGLYTHTGDTINSQAGMRGMLSTTLFAENYIGASGVSNHGYSNIVFPTSGITVYTVNYYDNYNFIADLSLGTNYNYLNTEIPIDNINAIPAQISGSNLRVLGLVTGAKVNVLGTPAFLKSISYYDSKDRVVQTLTDNNKTGTDRVTNIVDFSGRILKTKTTHKTNHPDQTVVKRFVYDHMNRVKQLYHTVNANAEVSLVQNSYNELGQLVTKGLNVGGTVTQNIDFLYNIRGWLLSMNNSQLSGDDHDLFGFELAYQTTFPTGTPTGNTPQFNGNISAMKWSQDAGLSANKDVVYNYTYDPLNRITAAGYLKNISSVWSNPTNMFSETGYGYDQNGNITGLLRNGVTGLTMDGLSYFYSLLSNQLQNVTDANTTDKTTNSFIDGNAGPNNDYTYDANGNMISDANKGITGITYNYMNLPLVVTKDASNYITYTYDATGKKLTQQVNSTPFSINEYDGEFIYTNDVLQFIQHDEGRIVMTGATPEYQYSLKDHLGNIRLTFTTITPSPITNSTSFESTSDFSQFDYVGGWIYNNPLAAHTGSYVSDIQGTDASQIALAKSYHIYAGEKVEMNGYAFFQNECCQGSSNFANFATALLGAFHLPIPTAGESNTASAALNTFGLAEAGGYGDGSFDEGDVRVFFTILVFDKNYNMIDVVYQQVTGSGEWNYMDVQYTATEESYVYAYISNEDQSLMNLYIDDVSLTYFPGIVIQAQDYYPFGLTFNSYNRENSLPNKYQYNSKELQTDLGLNWLDFGSRMYMSDIGRFGGNDILSDASRNLSPFAFCSNNPTNRVDSNGQKDKPFNAATDQPINIQAGTETPIQEIRDGNGRVIGVAPGAAEAYNCHSYAWEDCQGDPQDPRNAVLVSFGITKWDQNADNNISSQGYMQMPSDMSNEVGDRVIYYVDANGNGVYDPGESIQHSAIVHSVDRDGNTTSVIGKMGQGGISINHPDAPRYYHKDENGNKTSRGYFRKGTNQNQYYDPDQMCSPRSNGVGMTWTQFGGWLSNALSVNSSIVVVNIE